MTVTSISHDVSSFLADVRAELADLSVEERDDLMAEVEVSVIESASDSPIPIAERLGQPAEFASELRAAAGLRTTPSAVQAGPDALDRLRDVARTIAEHRRVRAVGSALAVLAPIWWVARGYLVVAGFVLISGAGWSVQHSAVPSWGGGANGAAVLVVATAVSCWLGLRRFRQVAARLATVALSLVAVAAIFPVVQHLRQPSRAQLVYQALAAEAQFRLDTTATSRGLAFDGVPVTNIYPYSRQGRLLHDVLLYDGAGRPLNLGADYSDPNRRVLVTRSGSRIFNSFPIRYFEPGTTYVAHPNAGPSVRPPAIKPRSLSPGRVTPQRTATTIGH
jgi:uncharacterized membrane protein